MSYKPPKQTIDDNDLKGVPSNEAVFEALKLKLPKPSVDGTTGQLLARGASADDTSWVNPPSTGANTSLSNLVAPTAVNVALLGTLGSVSAPAYSFTGDSNTGMWSSASDVLNLSTAGSERLRVTSSGNIGIGTTNPSTKLEVSGNIQASNGNLIVATAGKTLSLKQGSNASIGTADIVSAQTVQVTTSALTSNSLIFLTGQNGVNAFSVQNKNPGAGTFEIHHTGGNITATIAWMIIEAAPSDFDLNAEAFFLTAGITDPGQKAAVNQLVLDLKSYNIWTKMSAIYPFVGGSAISHSYNLKNTAQYQITWNGTVTHTINGVQGNGVNGYGNTNYSPSLGLQDDAHLSIYSRTDIDEVSFDFSAENTAQTEASNLILRFAGSGFFSKINTGTYTNVANANSLGFYTGSRTGSTTYKAYKNGSVVATSSVSSTTPTTYSLYIGARNAQNTTDLYTTRQYAFASIGSGLSDAEVANFYTAVQTYQTALGRNV